jgi:preprotein translocase subunit SecG
MPQWLVLLLCMLAACAAVIGVVFLRQRRVGEEDDPSQTPDVIEYMTMMIGVVYAIVLGLAIAGVWEARNAADETVQREAQALHEIHERAQVYPERDRQLIRQDVRAYVRHTVGDEWTFMVRQGELTARGDRLLDELRGDVLAVRPESTRAVQAYQGIVDQVARVDAARVQRAAQASPTMPTVVWFGLIGGGALSVGMVFALQIQRSRREMMLAGLFCALTVFLVFLVWHFDSPFERGLDRPTEAYTALFPHTG